MGPTRQEGKREGECEKVNEGKRERERERRARISKSSEESGRKTERAARENETLCVVRAEHARVVRWLDVLKSRCALCIEKMPDMIHLRHQVPCNRQGRLGIE